VSPKGPPAVWKIEKEFAFEASHRLPHLGLTHPCYHLHGHSYRVRLALEVPRLNANGFVYDYRLLDPIKRWLDEHLDHAVIVTDDDPLAGLYEQHEFKVFRLHGGPSSAENLAQRIHEAVRRILPDAPIVAVGVSETQKTWAWYRPNESV
jgi:6-pyruvoyltetrahydropterin/6-carboxytetrahydropterin synthase